jgi:hypothetical protein
MGTKNPNLCEQPYCREPWTHVVRFWSRRKGRSYEIHLCAEHVRSEEWDTPPFHDSCGNSWRTQRPLVEEP